MGAGRRQTVACRRKQGEQASGVDGDSASHCLVRTICRSAVLWEGKYWDNVSLQIAYNSVMTDG